jgi:hypothetical protein
MRISTYIQILELLLAEHGDMEVFQGTRPACPPKFEQITPVGPTKMTIKIVRLDS